MSQTGSPPPTASNVTLLTAQQTREHSNTALACIPVKPVTGTGCRFVIPVPIPPLGLRSFRSSQRSRKGHAQHDQSNKKRIPPTPSSLKSQDPQEDAICWEVACPHSPSIEFVVRECTAVFLHETTTACIPAYTSIHMINALLR
jgi:hypothetical protein